MRSTLIAAILTMTLLQTALVKAAVMSQSHYLNQVERAFSENKKLEERWAALMAVAQSEKTDRIEVLKRASVDKQWFMRSAALVGLQKAHPELALKTAEKLIQDKALMVRSASVEIIKNHKGEMNRALLWKELEQKYNFRGQQSLWVRAQIAELLAQSPLVTETDFFKNLVLDKDSEVQKHAAQALMQLAERRKLN